MNSRRIAIVSLILLTLIHSLCVPALCASGAPLSFAPDGDAPVLTLRRQANFREEGVRSGTLIELYADRSLLIFALGMLEDADAPMLMHAGSATDEDYLAVEHLLADGGFLLLPEWIETGVLDGDTVVLTARTDDGMRTVSAYSPDGTPFGDIVDGLESILGAYENTDGE